MELDKLYLATAEKGSVNVTMKRVLASKLNKNIPKEQKVDIEDDEPLLFVRAKTEERKISTAISAKDQLEFQALFSSIVKAHMSSLVSNQKES